MAASRTRMEVCIDCVQSAINAQAGGASRVELCANLMEGGTTPSLGMFNQVKKNVTLDVFVMIRPRGADFCYHPMELEVMKEDIRLFKEANADGIVLGALTPDGRIDMESMRELVALCRPLPVTFHRAFDMTADLPQALEDLVSLGIERVLTSGGETSCLEGLPMLTTLVKQAGSRITIMPGGGITEKNVNRILTGCGAKEFHGSCRSSVPSQMTFRNSSISMGAAFHPPEFTSKVTNQSRVSEILQIANYVL